MPKLFKEAKEATMPIALELAPNLWASEYVLEIRYEPNPRLLDHRGKYAQLLSQHAGLSEWRIDTNRLDVFSKDEKTRFFVAFRNAGAILMDCSSSEYFHAQSDKFLQWLFRQTEVGSRLNIERLGVRQRFGASFKGTFDELKERIANRYFQLPEAAREAIGKDAKLVDIGATLNWEGEIGSFNTSLGPMTEKELKDQFKRGEENPPPEVGLYFDIDYFRKPNRALLGVEITNAVKSMALEANSRYQRIHDLILG
jgi:hypothetical protein